MSHEITENNGRAEMAYVGEKPWHGLGQELPEGASIEVWQEAAGMQWSIERRDVKYVTNLETQAMRSWGEWEVLIRSDNLNPLGIVSKKFHIVQPKQVLEFFRDLAEVAGFRLNTAGTLRQGARFWAMASINAEDRIVGNDMIKGNLLFATACDGSMSSIVKNCCTRVVCANTMAVALNEKGASEVKVSHRGKFDEKKVKAQLGIAVTGFERFIKEARLLASHKISPEDAERLIASVVATNNPETLEEAYTDRGFQKVLALFQGAGMGSQLEGVKGTAWGAVNAITEYYDHHVRAYSSSTRMDSAWFGKGNEKKREAMSKALALIELD